ncbi:MAG: ATP-dependent Clp protease ATP-binding subunit [Christensenellales bacterium]
MNVRVTENFEKVFNTAFRLASETGGVVYSEHILYGLVSAKGSVASKILSDFISAEKLLNSFKLHSVGGAIFSERANRIRQKAINVALKSNRAAATEHILYAVLLESDSIAYEYMKNAGMNLNALIYELEKSFGLKTDDAYKNSDSNVLVADFNDLMGKLNNGILNGGAKPDVFKDLKETSDKSFDVKNSFDVKISSKTADNGLPSELGKFGVDLTQKARDGKLDPVIGRGKEIERVIQVLCRRTKNNPVLIGEPGVGKSAVLEGLSQAIVAENVPEALIGKTVFSLDLTSIVAGAKYRGEFEERFKSALDMIKSAGNILLFIDEIHTLMKTGGSEGALDAANILKPMLARGELQTIGATTIEEYRKYIEKDAALERRFQPVCVLEPSVSETVEILKGLKNKYEVHHKVTITDDALQAAAVMSERYVTDRFLPDKAIDLLDEACSKKKIYSFTVPDDIRKLESEISKIELEISEGEKNGQTSLVERLKAERDSLVNDKQSKEKEWADKVERSVPIVGENEIAEIVASWTGVPVTKLTETESQKLMNLGQHLKERVIGQDEAVDAIARSIKRARAGLGDDGRPIGSFVFLGPTGVGKTELSKALAAELFGDEELMIRIDMSEYMQKENVSKMIGSAPGYVGYDEGGQLTEKVRRKPYSVILFDEIEKAHPDVYNLLLQILDDGRLTDSQGRTVSFKNTVIIMTSNAGAAEINKGNIGFNTDDEAKSYEKKREAQVNALKSFMKPEFINRIDEIIVFHNLSLENVEKIGSLMLDKLIKRMSRQGIELVVTEEAKEYIFKKGYDAEYGARPLKRTISKLLEDSLSEEIILGNIQLGDKVEVVLENGDLTFNLSESN